MTRQWRQIAQAILVALGLGMAACSQEKPAVTEPPHAPQPASMPTTQPVDAESMLRRTEQRYREARTYRDEGAVRIKSIYEDRTTEDEKPFRTVFERDGRFRWEFRSSGVPGGTPTMQYVVWSRDQKTCDVWWDLFGVPKRQIFFEMAVGSAVGVSSGAATAVIPLLHKMQWGAKYTNLRNPTVKGTEKIQGVDCTIIEGGQEFTCEPVRLWLDSFFAIRQVFQSHEFGPSKISGLCGFAGEPAEIKVEKFVSETTITIKPTFDETIADEEFDFKPPGD
jgi:hypothetical protein